MSFDQSQVSRRAVAKGAAWSVPAVAVAAAAPSLAASHDCGTQSVSVTLLYDVAATQPFPLSQGTWTVTVSTVLPNCVHVGDVIPAPTLTVDVTTSTTAADTLRNLLQVVAVEGTGTSPYTIAGAVVGPGPRSATLTIPRTDVPASGAITTTGTGTGALETAASSPGTVTVTVGDSFTADLTGYRADGSTVAIAVNGTLQAGQTATLGTIDVVA